MTRLLFGRTSAMLTAFVLGGGGYVMLELLWRGRSHVSMFVVGGLCCCMLLWLSRNENLPFIVKSVAGGIFITAAEFAAGCILNLWLGLGVWDYSELPMHLWGQISLRFTLLWCVLSACALPLLRMGDRLLNRAGAHAMLQSSVKR